MHSKMMKVWFISIFGGSSCLLWHCRVTCDARVARVALSSRNCYGVSACMLKTFQHDGCSSCYFRAPEPQSHKESVFIWNCWGNIVPKDNIDKIAKPSLSDAVKHKPGVNTCSCGVSSAHDSVSEFQFLECNFNHWVVKAVFFLLEFR